MMLVFVGAVILLSSALTGTEAFGTSTTSSTCIRSSSPLSVKSSTKDDDVHVGSARQSPRKLQQLVHQKSDMESSKKKDCLMSCENLFDTNDNDDESRREALFSMVGALWAMTGTSIIATSPIKSAHAASGDFAKIELPNPYQTLSDRATKECLSESLGTRECLVYAEDSDKFLYKGLDASLLLQRLKTSTEALGKIPSLIEAKKWSQITGVLAGPMGELIRTMNQIVEMSSKSSESSSDATETLATTLRAKVNVVKKDLYALQAAVDKRQVDAALKYHTQSAIHLDEFIQAAI
jgi:hypothetical protein